MGIIHWYPDLPHVSLTQNVGENHRVLVQHTVFVGSPLHKPVRDLVKFKFFNVVGQPSGGVLDRPTAIGGVLMENLQMRRIHGILYRLKPIAVELRLYENFSMSILSNPHVEIRYQRQWLRT